MERFRRYMLEGACRSDAMERAVREHTLAVQLAEVAQMHEQRASRKQTNNTGGETEVNTTTQAHSDTAQTDEKKIALARQLASEANDYRAREAQAGRQIDYATAVKHVSALKRATAAVSAQDSVASADATTDEEKIALAKQLSDKAQAYLAEQRKAGNRWLTIADAVARVAADQ